jgi:CubicO group peptidase (beta-lactamase class C family)
VRGIAPTEVYLPQLHSAGPPSWLPLRAARAPCAHGEVHDDNAFVMGGVAGHAGLFGTAAGVLAVARGWLDGTFEGISTALRERFFAASTVPGSTRRLGWDGQAADGSGSSGGALEPPAVGHTGFTGTSVWVEPSRRRVHVLLSNRVHPVRGNDAIRALRIRFHRLAARL